MSATTDDAAPMQPSVPGWRKALARARSNPTTTFGVVLTLLIMFGAVFAP